MVKAKKKFGQNFLHDASVLRKITESIPKCEIIAEIGPGLGDLTAKILEISQVCSYEIDEELLNLLKKRFAEQIKSGKFELISGDVLEIWDENLLPRPYFLAANLPYYAATKMVLKAIDDENCLGFVVMVQREVAQKFCAKPGERDFSPLSILANLHGEAEILFDVSPQSFDPAPKVISSVIRLIKTRENLLKSANFSMNEYHEFKDFLKTAFLAPRKTLYKNLSSKFEKKPLEELFLALNLEPNLRPHQIQIALFIKIFNFLKAENGRKK